MILAILVANLAAADSLSLQQARALARANRPAARATAAAMAEARALVRVAGTVPNPTVGYSHTEDTPRAHLTVQQPLDWLFRRSADREAAVAGVAQTRADSARSAALLDAEVARAFYGLIAARAAFRLAEAGASIADSLAVLAGRRLAQGDVSAMEYDRIRLETARVRQSASRAREMVRAQAIEWGRAIGWTGSESPPAPTGDLGDGLTRAPGPATARAATLPLVRMAEADSVAAAWVSRSVRRGRLPIPGVEFGADWADPALPGRTLWLFGLSAPIPMWHRSGGAVQAAAAREQRATADLAEARLTAASRLATVRSRVREAAGRALTARDSLVPLARRLQAQAVRAYGLGETGVVPVLDALRAEREVEATAIEDLLSYQEARAEWCALTGECD